MRLEIEFRGWAEEGRGSIAWLDWPIEAEKFQLCSFATSAMFPAGDQFSNKFLALDWICFCKKLAHFARTRHVCFWFFHQLKFFKTVRLSAAVTCLRCSSSSYSISKSGYFICFSISMRSFASLCFSSSSYLSLDIPQSCGCCLVFFEEIIYEPDFEWWDVHCSAVFLSWTESMYPRAAANKRKSLSAQNLARDRSGDKTDGRACQTSNTRCNGKREGRMGMLGEQRATKRENGRTGRKRWVNSVWRGGEQYGWKRYIGRRAHDAAGKG